MKDKSAQEGGYFVGPTIFDGVTSEMKIWQDVIFAPVLSIARVKNLDVAISLTNQSSFANRSCIFTNDGGSVQQFREEIDAGMLVVYIGDPASTAFYSLSGRKDSFYWYLHANGKDGVHFYSRRKVMTGRWLK